MRFSTNSSTHHYPESSKRKRTVWICLNRSSFVLSIEQTNTGLSWNLVTVPVDSEFIDIFNFAHRNAITEKDSEATTAFLKMIGDIQ